jgi:hypothetical protein
MDLRTKPDLDEALTRWRHFWNGEVYKRPLVMGCVATGPVEKHPWFGGYKRAVEGNHQETLDRIDALLDAQDYIGEMIPCFIVDHGPDQYAAFLGAELTFSDASPDTNWVDPIVDDWDDFLPFRFDENNPTYQSVLRFARAMAEHAEGRYHVSPLDAHSHADTLSALRGPQQFAMDLIESPKKVEEAMRQIRPMFRTVYDAVYKAARMDDGRGCCIGGHWAEGRFSYVQCDFIFLIGPEHFRRFILPAIEEEVEYLDHSYFHLDGPGSFTHLDDLLAIPNLGIISVDSGTGQKANHLWVDLFKRILAAGKMIRAYGEGLNLDRIKVLHRELGPKGVIYCPEVGTREGLEEIMDWLERNT